MNWLHFCDFHTGRKPGPQANALASLVSTVERECASISIDAVFLTGDLSFSGAREEYEEFGRLFLGPLRSIPNIKNAKIVAVPGNHDVDCNVGVPITWDSIRRKQAIFFCEDVEGCSARRHRAECFRNYWDFVTAEGLLSPNPQEEVSRLFAFPDFPATIVATNTAFFSDIEEHKHPRSIPIGIASFRSRFRKDKAGKPVLLIGHHSPDSFRTDQIKAFRSLLTENKAIYIHGHEHEPSTDFNHDGSLRTLGFGASYLDHLEKTSASPYKNTFALCTLADRLYIRSFAWEGDIGQWKESSTSQFNECPEATNDRLGRCVCATVSLVSPEPQPDTSVPISSIPRAVAKPMQIVPVGAPSVKLWRLLATLSDNLSHIIRRKDLKSIDLPSSDEKFEHYIESEDERHLVVVIPGINHVLAAKEVESFNTRLDTQDFTTVTVLSLGRISADANTLYLRLQKSGKRLEILENRDLTSLAHVLMSREQLAHLDALDAANTTVTLLVENQSVFSLVHRDTPSVAEFYIVGENGGVITDASELVVSLRRSDPNFARIPYRGEAHQMPLLVAATFDEASYLKTCFKEYNSTKYAALAHIGLRFSDLPLRELYIDATAAETAGQGNSKVEAIVEDHLAPLPLSDALKSFIQRDLISSIGSSGVHESSDAREFCQRFSAVLITGDPGAGKTCFVKHEILAYCDRAVGNGEQTRNNWHASHVPVLIQLSEVVSEPDFDSIGLFGVGARLLARKGIGIPPDQLRALAEKGRLAAFFDGLDEVVSIEKRAVVVKLINELCETYLTRGNRIVVTSRPAAVHVVNFLPAFHRLELQGLTESNIRLLANRILSLRLSETSTGSVVDQRSLQPVDSMLVSKLLADCHDKPGVMRLAQNPLLLTLLILIYANSGEPAAKRHAIYEDAIKTLSSVRRREAGHTPISAQDLRERLGAVALSVYKNESGLLPTRREVRQVIMKRMSQQRSERVTESESDEFIQKVAEATGLISIGRNGTADDEAVITFMHHSFLEYFAALGLSFELDSVRIEDLVSKPRWLEILTLLAGIIGENEDVAPYISKVINAITPAQDVNGKLLCFAIDCALECDVASEAAQRLIARALRASIELGPARLDPWVRSELGRRLRLLFQSCGSAEFEPVLLSLITDGSEEQAAAAIRICGHAWEGDAPSRIVEAVEKAKSRNEECVTIAICWAAGESPSFRSDGLLEVVLESLKKSRQRKQAAFDAIARIPGLAATQWHEIIAAMDDDDPNVRRTACSAAVQAGLNADLIALSASKKDILVRSLRYVDDFAAGKYASNTEISFSTLEHLMASGDKRNRLIGISLLPLSAADEREIYEQLLEIVRSEDDREAVSAALTALRNAAGAMALITQSDVKQVLQWVNNGTRNVRIAGMRLLSLLGNDTTVVGFMLKCNREEMDADEFGIYMHVMGGVKVLRTEAAEMASGEFIGLTGTALAMGKEKVTRLNACLDCLRRLEQNVGERVRTRVTALIDDFRVDTTVRGRALMAIPAISTPTPKLVSELTARLAKPDLKFESELAQIPSVIAKKCKEDVDYVLACIHALGDLRSAAVKFHQQIAGRGYSMENELKVSELRGGIEEIESIVAAFEEYLSKPRQQAMGSMGGSGTAAATA